MEVLPDGCGASELEEWLGQRDAVDDVGPDVRHEAVGSAPGLVDVMRLAEVADGLAEERLVTFLGSATPEPGQATQRPQNRS